MQNKDIYFVGMKEGDILYSPVRVLQRDGVNYTGTYEFNHQCLNLYITNGVITKYHWG